MLIISVRRSSITAVIVTVDIIVKVDPTTTSLGIQQVRVETSDHYEVAAPVDGGCQPFVTFTVPVPRDKLPIYIVATECAAPDASAPTTTVVGPYLNEDRTPGPSGPAPVICLPAIVNQPNMNNTACIEANNQAQSIRNSIQMYCARKAEQRRHRDEAAVVAAAGFVAAAALASAGAAASTIPVFGTALMVILLVAAAIALAVAIGTSIAAASYSQAMSNTTKKITDLQTQYAEVLQTIRTVCCPDFITASLDIPTCQ